MATIPYDYLIIGGGMTAAAAANGIREADPRGSIAIISDEAQRPYGRPPLSKKLWQGKPESIIWRKLPEDNLELLLSTRIRALDLAGKQALDEAGRAYGYKKLLLATGGRPRRLPFAPPETLFYRTVEDYHTARSWTGRRARIGVIGGGFIGSELGAVLANLGEKVGMWFMEPDIGARLYPADLARFVTGYYREKGVEVHPSADIQAIERRGERFVIRAKDSPEVEVDHLLGGIGIIPNTELAREAGIAVGGPEVGGGILVDEFLRTDHADVYAAGDVASFYFSLLQRQTRIEHADNADTMGRAAGMNMVGVNQPFTHQPFFWSDLFDLGFEAVGELDPRLETFSDWKEPYREGVIYYLKERKVRGVLLWNTWDQVEAAVRLIEEGRVWTESELKGRLPEGP